MRKEVTIKYRAGHSYSSIYEKIKGVFCPDCGKKEVWIELNNGDYYLGETYVCTSCKYIFTLPSGHSAESSEDNQLIDQLKEIE